MGSAASIDISQQALNEKHIVELMQSSNKREELFLHIDEYLIKKGDDHISLKDKIGMKKILQYFLDPKNSLYPGFVVNREIVDEALNQVLRSKAKKVKKSENSKNLQEKNITLKDFHAFFPILLLFVRLWKIFDAVDGLIVSDRRILKAEFLKIREELHKIDDLTIIDVHNVKEEDWLKFWNDLNTNNDELISFHEVCEFALSHIHRAFSYDDYITASAAEEDSLIEAQIKEEHPTGQGFDGLIVTPTHYKSDVIPPTTDITTAATA